MADDNRWMHQGAKRQMANAPSDATSAYIMQALKDKRNLEALEMLDSNHDKATTQAILNPILQLVAERVKETLAQGGVPKQDETTQLLNDHLKRTLTMRQIEDLDRRGSQNGSPIAETLQVMKAAGDAHRELSEMATRRAEQAEAEAAGQVGFAVQTERERNDFIMSIFSETKAQELKREQDMAQLQMKLMETQSSQQVAILSAKLDQLLMSKDQELERYKAQVELEKTRLLAEAQVQLAIKDKDHEIERLKQHSALPPSADPQYLYHMSWVRAQEEDRAAARAQQQAEHENRLKMYDWVREDVGPKGLDTLTTIAKQFGGGLSVDNAAAAAGVPPKPPSAPGIGGAG